MKPKTLFIFPGQGSQYPGIGSDVVARYPEAKQTFEQASDILSIDMSKLCFEDPDGRIHLTRYTQLVLVTHHIACLRVLQANTAIVPDIAAGHSLGEYSALATAGSLSFEQALRLVRRRGELMGEFGKGEMSALPISSEEARSWADAYYCAIGGINLPQQTVVAGASEDLDRLEQAFQIAQPKRKAIRLKTEGAFHSYHMVEAANRFREVLDDTEFSTPTMSVLSNYTGAAHGEDVEQIKARLFFQLFHPVNWLGCLHSAFDQGVARVLELGGGIGSGATPAEKRPNLESIVKKAARSGGVAVEYHPAINVDTIAALPAE